MNRSCKYAVFLTIFCGVLGFVYYAWQQRWIIVTIPAGLVTKPCTNCTKKRAQIFYFCNKWEHENIEILWSENEAQTAQQLIQAVLLLLSENASTKKIAVEQVLTSANNQQLLVFFDKSPLPKNVSIRAKLMIIESFLKTLRENGIKAPFIYFLVHNQPLPDAHLDFSLAWPIQDFVEN